MYVTMLHMYEMTKDYCVPSIITQTSNQPTYIWQASTMVATTIHRVSCIRILASMEMPTQQYYVLSPFCFDTTRFLFGHL